MIIWLATEFYNEIIFPKILEGHLQTSMRDMREKSVATWEHYRVLKTDLGPLRVREWRKCLEKS